MNWSERKPGSVLRLSKICPVMGDFVQSQGSLRTGCQSVAKTATQRWTILHQFQPHICCHCKTKLAPPAGRVRPHPLK